MMSSNDKLLIGSSVQNPVRRAPGQVGVEDIVLGDEADGPCVILDPSWEAVQEHLPGGRYPHGPEGGDPGIAY